METADSVVQAAASGPEFASPVASCVALGELLTLSDLVASSRKMEIIPIFHRHRNPELMSKPLRNFGLRPILALWVIVLDKVPASTELSDHEALLLAETQGSVPPAPVTTFCRRIRA